MGQSIMAYANFAIDRSRSDNMHNTFSSFEAADKKWTYTTGIINYTVLFKEHPISSQESFTTTLSSAKYVLSKSCSGVRYRATKAFRVL